MVGVREQWRVNTGNETINEINKYWNTTAFNQIVFCFLILNIYIWLFVLAASCGGNTVFQLTSEIVISLICEGCNFDKEIKFLSSSNVMVCLYCISLAEFWKHRGETTSIVGIIFIYQSFHSQRVIYFTISMVIFRVVGMWEWIVISLFRNLINHCSFTHSLAS